MRYALIENTQVLNVVEWDGETSWTPPSNTQLVPSDTAGPGWTYISGVFTAPSPSPTFPIPAINIISDRQFFQALALRGLITNQEALDAVRTGTLPTGLQALLANIPPNDLFAAEMHLSGSTEFHRNHPLTALLGQGFGWTSTQLDELWRDASQL